ncbi:similar to Saccharomyces cerevisiae YER182W FMP10 Putative protein of unknown function [Maudiozyma saulgeensis]|uniref:Thioesterase domain-containing protein n=1 Tax=Maudiozyma saulgeensis TaxID=1789683 RepID=A0A1X7RC21_9SACH|nr:similar to Saccharomyces cerevisiae YER182W FMP10 Putative protein of unknown function [Kazachstania saulgeensis]
MSGVITRQSIKAVGNGLTRRWMATRYMSNGPRFITGGPRKGKWIPWTIFGVSFATGWFFTQHMTFTDVLAWWRYDSLPKDSTEVKDYEAQLTARAEQLPVVKQLLAKGFVEVFPASKNTSGKQVTSGLVTQALRSPGAIAIEPKFYYNPQTRDTVGLYHLGMKLTGYPFIVHGGMLATVMEDLMRQAMLVRGGNSDMANCEKTRDLNVSYKFPTFANQFVVVRTTAVEQFGQGTKMRCEVLDQTGNNTLVTGGAVFTKP